MNGGTLEPNVGVFWLLGNESTPLPGALTFVEGRPEIKVMGELTPSHDVVERFSDGSVGLAVAKDDSFALTVQGETADPPYKVTIVGCGTSQRRAALFGHGVHSVRGDYAVIGAHVAEDYTFESFRFRVHGMEQWFGLPRTQPGYKLGEPFVQLTWEGEKRRVIETGSGRLAVEEVAISPQWPGSPMELAIEEQVWLVWTPENPSSLQNFMSDVANPLRCLMTVAYSKTCPIEQVQAKAPDGKGWLSIEGQFIEGFSKAERQELRFKQSYFSKELIEFWLDSFEKYSPIPQILSSSIGGELRLLEVDALMLCTAIEGLHKRLYPDKMGVYETGKKAGLERELFFKERLSDLVIDVRAYIPEITPESDEWLTFVTGVRNGQAHQGLSNKTDSGHLERMMISADVLRWILRVRLVQGAGLDPEVFRYWLETDRYYRQLILNFRDTEPSTLELTAN